MANYPEGEIKEMEEVRQQMRSRAPIWDPLVLFVIVASEGAAVCTGALGPTPASALLSLDRCSLHFGEIPRRSTWPRDSTRRRPPP